MSSSTYPQLPKRRAEDSGRDSASDRERILRLLFSLILLASVSALGWWYWRHASGFSIVRDGSPSWSHDSKRIVFSSEDHGQADIVTASLTGADREEILKWPTDEAEPAFSPDGKRIAFSTNLDGNYEIYTMFADGSSPTPLRITNHPARDTAPAWFPGGNKIVFMSTRGGAEYDIYQMDADGSNVQALTTGGSYWFPQVSPDSANIALHKLRDIYVLNLRSKAMRRLTYEPANGMHPTWSPDGRQIAFMSWRNGRTELFTAKSDGSDSDQQLLVSMPTGDAVDPSWSPNGQYIAFVHVIGKVAETQQRVVYIVDVNSKRLTRISK